MKERLFHLQLIAICFLLSCGHGGKENYLPVKFEASKTEKKIDVFIGGQLFTSYCWYDNVYKPTLWPIYTSQGTEITRGFPLKPRAGERLNEHHQIGMYLSYGNVNGYDFWSNGKNGIKKGGEIKHIKVEKMIGGNEGLFVTEESWIDPSGKELLAEKSEYRFSGKGSVRIVDRITTLTAVGDTIKMFDTKEGMFGIRVCRQLELPSEDKDFLTDSDGDTSAVRANTNIDVSGNYRSSEGVTGSGVWGTRARWMDLYGKIGDEIISIAVCDHPLNQGYPTYWHARPYGLLAANPLGSKVFTAGRINLNFYIPAGRSTTFRYRVLINSGADLTDDQLNAYADDFAGRYRN